MLFEDRKIIYSEEAPSGRWKLTVYAPPEGEPAMDPYGPGPYFFAEFEKKSGVIAHGFPFGTRESGAELRVDWSLPGKVCSISLGDECYLLFKWGICFLRPREKNRIDSEGPITAEEVEEFCELALKENPDQPV